LLLQPVLAAALLQVHGRHQHGAAALQERSGRHQRRLAGNVQIIIAGQKTALAGVGCQAWMLAAQQLVDAVM
jgi:hypothetical protein